MTIAKFHIRRKRHWLGFLKPDSFKSALQDSYGIQLEIDGKSVLIGNGGQSETKARLISKESPRKELVNFLKQYRKNPSSTTFDESISKCLHRMIFPNPSFLTAFAKATGMVEWILLEPDKTSRMIATNIPWELTATEDSSLASSLCGTFASLPFARVIAGTQSELVNNSKEVMRVVYCVSEPPEDPFGAEDFNKAIQASLQRSGMLKDYPVLGNTFSPSFEQIASAIKQTRPHILVLVCHGSIKDGIPHLLFEQWYPITELGECLARVGSTLLVLLIACDQVFQDEQPSAHSGAVTLLEKGVPAVVAMQSSVRASLAGEFLGAVIDHFFQSTSIALAVAGARVRMARGSDPKSHVEWSLPSLFVTEDALDRLSMISDLVEGFEPSLQQLIRSVPQVPTYYFPRIKEEQRLSAMIGSKETGVRIVVGGFGCGKTQLVQRVCRSTLTTALSRKNRDFRAVLYYDLGRDSTSSPIQDLSMLLVRIGERIQEVQPPASSPVLFRWPTIRSIDGELLGTNTLEKLIRLIDENEMILIIDNVRDAATELWGSVIEEAKNLINSVIVIVTDSQPSVDIDDSHKLQVRALNKKQTAEYTSRHIRHLEVNEVFSKTGGILLLLDSLRREAPGLPHDMHIRDHITDAEVIRKEYVQMALKLLSSYPQEIQDFLYSLANLPHGVNPDLAKQYVGDWVILLDLELSDWLVREYRYDIPWLYVPNILAKGLRETRSSEVKRAREELTDHFIQNIRSNNPNEAQEKLNELASLPGAIYFLHDIHVLLIERGFTVSARALTTLLHNWFYQRACWDDAYRFWERVMEHVPLTDIKAEEWLCFGEVARLLGRQEKALECLDRARNAGPTQLDRVDIHLLEASIIKDTADVARIEDIREAYKEAISTTEDALKQLQQAEGLEDEVWNYRTRHAYALYNQAIFRRWWLKDIDRALKDNQTATELFKELGLDHMRYVAVSERCDMVMDLPEVIDDWTKLLKHLSDSADYFVKNDNLSDAALAMYRLGKCYRRLPYSNEADLQSNLRKVADAYHRASEMARNVSDLRLALIAQAHDIELSWQQLGTIPATEAIETLDKVIGLLHVFRGDAWATRVLRDSLLLQSTAEKQDKRTEYITTLNEALDVAVHAPLRPKEGTDAVRAAAILDEYLQALLTEGKNLSFDRIALKHRELIEGWLKRSINITSQPEWLENLHNFGRRPGGYHG